MNRKRIEEIFSPARRVVVKPMFGGHGIYADGLFLAIETGGEIYLKVDALTRPLFLSANSAPFVYTRGKSQKPITMSYWRLVATAYEDPDELNRWVFLALDAAHRARSRSR